jgi:VRR-NUC domain
MLESQIQAQLIRKFEAQNYWVLKIVKANKNGIFDLLLIDKTTCVASWVEVKAKNGKISPLQKLRARELRSFGCRVNFVTEGGEPFPEGEDLEIMDF